LVAISPGDHLRRRDLVPWLSALASAGLRTLVLREPHLKAAAYEALALEAREMLPSVILHARCAGAPALAAKLGLGLHLPGKGNPRAVRVPGLLGVSCHSAAEVARALSAGADYAFLSPVWHPTSKPGDTRPAMGLYTFLAIATGSPVLALGGVTPERYRSLIAGGARGAAVCGGLFGVSGPEAASARLAAFLGQNTKMSSS